jgi:spore maturation protein SpmB
MKTAAQQTESFGTSLKSLVGAYVGFEALKMGAERLKEYIGGAIEGVSQTKILAERVGLSASSFGRLTYAAGLAHIGQDELTVSLEQMNKRLGEVAIDGTGPAGDALKRFGVDAADAAKLGTEGAFMKLMGVMSQIQNPAERAAVAMDLFGKSGQGMINLVAQGLPGLKATGDEATRLGGALSDIGYEKVEEASRSFLKLSAAAQGFANLIVEQLSPYIVALTDAYLDWAYSGTKSTDFVANGMSWVTAGLGYAADAVNVLKVAFFNMQAVVTSFFAMFAHGIDNFLSGLGWVVEKLTGTQDVMTNFFGTWADDLDRLAKEQFAAGAAAFDRIGKGGEFMQSIVTHANERAKERANEAKAFTTAGAIVPGPSKDKEKSGEKAKEFGAAAEFGSKEAYSSILRSMSAASGITEQRKISTNTQRGADASERSAAFLAKMAEGARTAMGIKPYMPGAI